jgi:pimeloyl-ACP methyl ester carboxylesterase
MDKLESKSPRRRKQKQTEDGKRKFSAWLGLAALLIAFVATLSAQELAASQDSSLHKVQSINVDRGVNLEVLDWGGSGRSLILLAGLGSTAHAFDQFAPKLTSLCHVYGITRRGFGASTEPTPMDGNYVADRLGDDVLVVIESLNLHRPVLVGHSIAGEELSSVASRHPEEVAGLIYLDAAYSYAYYDRSRGDAWIDSVELRRKLEQLIPGRGPQYPKQAVEGLLQMLPRFERTLREWHKDLEALPPRPTPVLPVLTPAQAILEGQQKYTNIGVPALAIYAIPKDLGPAFNNNPAARRAAEARQLATDGAQARAFKKGVPSARVVRLAHASHFVFLSNEVDVLREMRAFLEGLE